jgi:chloride channel protein, CIC family
LIWVAAALLMGAVSGLAAASFLSAVKLAVKWFQGGFVHYVPATTAADGVVHVAGRLGHPWALPLVTAGGALVASLIGGRLAPETGGHGTDAAIAAAHNDPKGMRSRVPVVKALTAALTLGSGGSGGTEGPIAQIGGALGSTFARRAKLPDRHARTLLMTGLGSGIGAIFRAPLSGGVLAAELLHKRGITAHILFPAALASGTAYGVFGALHGFTPLFGARWLKVVPSPGDLVLYALVGVVCGVVGRLYRRCFYWIHDLTERWIRRPPGRRALPAWAPPALGGLLVGLLGMEIPEVLGPGYGTIQQLLTPASLAGMSLWLVLLLPFAKIVATSLSIGTGGSGGIFGPGLIIGAATGAAIWRLATSLGFDSQGPLVLTVVAMAACLGAIIRAPFGVSILVLESTRSPGLILPTAVATLVAYWLVGNQTLYQSQDEEGEYRFSALVRACVRSPVRLLGHVGRETGAFVHYAARYLVRRKKAAAEVMVVIPAESAGPGRPADPLEPVDPLESAESAESAESLELAEAAGPAEDMAAEPSPAVRYASRPNGTRPARRAGETRTRW